MELFNVGPIISMLALAVLVFLLVTRGLQAKKRTSSSKKRPLFFSFYISILIVSLVVYLVIPNKHMETLDEYEGDFDGWIPFYDVLNEEKPVDTIEEFKQTEETYPMTGDTLDFTETNANHYYRSIDILIIQDPSFTDAFKVESYETPFIYEEKDFSRFIEPIKVGGNDGVVHMHFPTKDTVLNTYDYSFPFTQFLEQPRVLGSHSDYIPSEQLIVIYIPEDVTPNVAHITSSDLYHIEMITAD